MASVKRDRGFVPLAFPCEVPWLPPADGFFDLLLWFDDGPVDGQRRFKFLEAELDPVSAAGAARGNDRVQGHQHPGRNVSAEAVQRRRGPTDDGRHLQRRQGTSADPGAGRHFLGVHSPGSVAGATHPALPPAAGPLRRHAAPVGRGAVRGPLRLRGDRAGPAAVRLHGAAAEDRHRVQAGHGRGPGAGRGAHLDALHGRELPRHAVRGHHPGQYVLHHLRHVPLNET